MGIPSRNWVTVSTSTDCDVEVKSTKDKLVSLSSTETEVHALVECVKSVLTMREFLNQLGFPQHEPTVVYTDNMSAILLVRNYGAEKNSKYYVTRINFLRD